MKTNLKTSNMCAGPGAGRSKHPKRTWKRRLGRMMILLFSGLWLLSSCHFPHRLKDDNKITFTWEGREGQVLLCAEKGKAVEIVWGDLRKSRFEGDGDVHMFGHIYLTEKSHTVTIRGEVTQFECSESRLTALDVSRDSALTILRCNQNQLTALDIGNNAALSVLDCSANQLTVLDASRNPALKDLNCSHNQLLTLQTGENAALETLDCSHNQLTDLDASRNPALKDINCSHNRLLTLQAGENAALETLDCSHNKLTSLDVSKNGLLTELLCNNNLLTRLDKSKKQTFARINIEGNNFPPKELTLTEAVRRKQIDFSASGGGIQSSVITVTNLSDEKLKLVIPPGTYLSSRSGSVQNMVITAQYDIVLSPKEKTTLNVNTACMNIHRSIPGSSNSFGAAQRPAGDLLTKVIRLLREGNYSYPVIQAAVWIVTDNASYNDTGILRSNSTRAIDRKDYDTAREIVRKARKK